MNHIEPTYLRFVYDKLEKGILNSENPSSLPDGFVGIYEQEFVANMPVNERQNTLLKFGLWSLFKAAVSLETFSLIFNIDQSEARVFIDTYSNWFNSPEPGKYQLYHDRIKVFFLQKLKDDEIKELNNNIINTIIKYLDSTESDIKHSYGLQFLGYHQLIEAGINKSFQDFINICLDRNFIEQQIKVSNSYVWSKEPIKQALKLATFHQNKKVVFELSKSLVNISSKEKDDLSDILTLIDNSEDQIVIERLNSIIDGSDDNLQISYILHILTIYSILENNKTSSSTERVNLYIRNIEDNFTENHDVIDQYMLISGNITLKVIYELYKISVESDFIFKRCSEIKVNPKNLAQYTFKELKILYDLIQKFYGQKSSLSILCNIIEAGYDEKDFFSKEVLKIIDLNPDLISSLKSRRIPLPEKLIQLTNDRRLINYFYEEYLNKGINEIPRSYYKSKFKFKGDSNLKDLLPFPSGYQITDISKIYTSKDCLTISRKLSKWFYQYDEFEPVSDETKILDFNSAAQLLILRTLVNKYDLNVSSFDELFIQYNFHLYEVNKIFEKNIISISDEKWLMNFIDNIDNQLLLNGDTLNKSHSIMNHNLYSESISETKCHLLINQFYRNNVNEHAFYKDLISNILNCDEIDRVRFLYKIRDCLNYKIAVKVAEKIESKKYKLDSLKRTIFYQTIEAYFIESDFNSINKIIANEFDKLKPNFRYGFLSYCIYSVRTIKQAAFLLEKYEEIKQVKSDSDQFKELKWLVDLLLKIQHNNSNLKEKIIFKVNKKIELFKHPSWIYMSIQYLSEKIDFNIKDIYSYYFKSFKIKKDFSHDLNSFLMNHKLLPFESIVNFTTNKSVFIYCIKNNLVKYFTENQLNNLVDFSDEDLINLTRYLCNQNVEIFISLIDSVEDTYNQLEFKNEIYYQLTQDSLNTSVIDFEYEISKEDFVEEGQERYVVGIIIKSIKSIENKSESFKILNQCIIELDKLDEDVIDMDTGEILDPNYEKVKALFFIINNLWKIGEKNIARQQLKSAFEFYNKIDGIKPRHWINKLENISLFVLDNSELKEFLKEKMNELQIVSTRFIEVVYTKKFHDLISLWEQNLICLLKEKIERDVIDSEVRKYIKYNSLERAFVFGKQIKNQKNSIEWKNILIEYVDARSKALKGDLSFDNYELVYNSIESTKVLENMLIYELFRDITSNIKKKKITNKYSGYATSHDIDEIFNTMKSLQAK